MGSVGGIYLLSLGILVAVLFFFIFALWGDITIVFLFWFFSSIFLGKEFFLVSVPGLPDIYIERLVFIALAAVFLYLIWMRRERLLPNTAIEYWMILLLVVSLVSMSLTGFLAISKR